MRTIIIGIIFAALLSGCTMNREQTELLSRYEKKKQYHRELLKTEKIQLYENNVTKVALTATYLSPLSSDANSTEDERFIVGLYLDSEVEQADMLDFNLSLNGVVPKSIVPLQPHDKRLAYISFVSEWNSFFLVSFPHVEAKRLTLVVESEQYGKGELHFAKRAKYTFTKRAF